MAASLKDHPKTAIAGKEYAERAWQDWFDLMVRFLRLTFSGGAARQALVKTSDPNFEFGWAAVPRLVEVPTEPAAPGQPGDYAVDAGYRYDYVAGTGWIRIAKSDW